MQRACVPPFYDSLVGKLVAWDPDREEVIQRPKRALRENHPERTKTKIPLHLRLLEEDTFRSGAYHTGYL